MNKTWKVLSNITGILMMIPGMPVLLLGLAWIVYSCWVLVNPNPYTENAAKYGILWIVVVWLTVICGLILVTQAGASLNNRISRPVRFPSFLILVWALIILGVSGWMMVDTPAGGLLFPPIFFLAGVLPPLAVLTWGQPQGQQLTWRRFLLAFAIGSSLAVLLAILLEVFLPFFILTIAQGLYEQIQATAKTVLDALSGKTVSNVISSPFFIMALIELGIIAPLVEEFVKPLLVLPMIHNAEGRKQAFWVGASAGAGFAALENLLYTGFGLNIWQGILVLRILSAAVHPLGAGLVALGWYEVFHPDEQTGVNRRNRLVNWLGGYAPAVGIHALWNGGSLLVFSLASTEFFGKTSAEVDIFGLTLAGISLAFLIVVGVGALMVFRSIAQQSEAQSIETLNPVSWVEQGAEMAGGAGQKSLALWAITCLLMVLPLVISTLQVLQIGALP